MNEDFPKRPKRRAYLSGKAESSADSKNDLSRRELIEWMTYQRGVVRQLTRLLEQEQDRLAEVEELVGKDGLSFDPQLTYRKILRIGRLQGVAHSFRDGYQESWTWKEKIMYIINFQKYPMRLRDILRAFEYLDSEAGLIRNLSNTLSVYIGQLKKSGRLIHYKPPGHRNGSYVHPNWLDENGRLLPEYDNNPHE